MGIIAVMSIVGIAIHYNNKKKRRLIKESVDIDNEVNIRHKRKIPEGIIKPEAISIKLHCTNCGTEILDKTGDFCSKCGAPLK